MKKFFTMALALMMSVGAMAQDEKHEISVGVGYGTVPQLADGMYEALTSPIADETKNKSFDGAYFVSYGYHINPKLVVGGEFSMSHMKKDGLKDGVKVSDIKDNYFAIMPGVKMNWINKERFAFYSRANIGIDILLMKETNLREPVTETKTTSIGFIFQLSPVGVEFGGQFRGFCEVGFGADGLVNAGLRYKF